MKANGRLSGGKLLKINGRISIPVSFVLAHAVAHIYSAVAIFDPKMQKYIVCISHSNEFSVGRTLEI